ncbi:hypothetical protein CP556_14310 [Natrinema sp. CBA1119]|nr:hypothetical protein CP556_14310 [Natrinema sp. CBA1119]
MSATGITVRRNTRTVFEQGANDRRLEILSDATDRDEFSVAERKDELRSRTERDLGQCSTTRTFDMLFVRFVCQRI